VATAWRRGPGCSRTATAGSRSRSDTLDTLEAFTEAGADRATFHLETVPESETLRKLDELSALIGRYGR
jgi:hypothetical protein